MASCRNADLTGICLANAYLDDADLTGACLRGANLAGAFMNRTNLTNADLRDAYFSPFETAGAIFDGIILTGAEVDEWTPWPEGFDPLAHGAAMIDYSKYNKKSLSKE
jgi:uncharacterized protein YjbI with pentapeptide repeats